MVSIPEISCPACQAARLRCLAQPRVSYGKISLAEPGSIYECGHCGLLFRRPYPAPAELAAAYGELPADSWDNVAGRTDFQLAGKIVQRFCEAGRILDVGCFRGDFLATLPENYEKYGVEPARAARAAAGQRGVQLIGDCLQDVRPGEHLFDAVTAIDVIEHLPHPMEALEQLAGLLVPGGVLVVSTGNSDALPWRMMRRDYWYYSEDHVSFYNPGWFRWAAARLGLSVVKVEKFSHSSRSRSPGAGLEKWRELARCAAFWMVDRGRGRAVWDQALRNIRPFSKVYHQSSAPGTSLWPDHMLIALRK